MEKFPKELKYSETHEWVHKEGDDTVVIGVTEHAQSQLGEIVFVELPDIEIEVHASDEVCVLESVKAAADVYSPLSGKIIAINEDLEESPGLVNKDPYGDGWLYKLELKDHVEFNELMDASSYQETIAE